MIRRKSVLALGPSRILGRESVTLPLDDVTNQGLFWYIGTQGNTTSFSNPSTSGEVALTASSTGGGQLSYTTDRLTNDWYTSDTPGGWWKVDVAPASLRRFSPTHLRFRQRYNGSTDKLQAFNFDGSTDNTNWDRLATVTDGMLNEATAAWNTVILTSTINYRYFRLTNTANSTNGYDYLILSQVELFGTLV